MIIIPSKVKYLIFKIFSVEKKNQISKININKLNELFNKDTNDFMKIKN